MTNISILGPCIHEDMKLTRLHKSKQTRTIVQNIHCQTEKQPVESIFHNEIFRPSLKWVGLTSTIYLTFFFRHITFFSKSHSSFVHLNTRIFQDFGEPFHGTLTLLDCHMYGPKKIGIHSLHIPRNVRNRHQWPENSSSQLCNKRQTLGDSSSSRIRKRGWRNLKYLELLLFCWSRAQPGCVVCFSSPQVAGVPRFRFGPSDDMPQTTSSSHSDLGQLASQGGNPTTTLNTLPAAATTE